MLTCKRWLASPQRTHIHTHTHKHMHAHTYTPTTLTHIKEKRSLSLWINQAQIEQIFYSQQKKKKKTNKRGKEGWGRQYNRHTQLGNPNWNLTNCCLSSHGNKLNKFSFKLISVSSVTHATYYIIHYIYTTL